MLMDGTAGRVLKVKYNSPALQLRAVVALASRSLCSSCLQLSWLCLFSPFHPVFVAFCYSG